MDSLIPRRTITVDIDGITTVHDVYMLILQELIENAGIEGAVLSDLNGLPIASALSPGVEDDYIAAVSASALTFIDRIGEEINSGGMFEQMVVKIGNKLVVISAIGDEALLTVMATSRTNLGVLMAEMRKAHARLAELLLGDVVPLLADIEESHVRV